MRRLIPQQKRSRVLQAYAKVLGHCSSLITVREPYHIDAPDALNGCVVERTNGKAIVADEHILNTSAFTAIRLMHHV